MRHPLRVCFVALAALGLTRIGHATEATNPDPVGQIIDAAKANQQAYTRLQHLTDTIGPRLSGSKALEQAITWAETQLKADGLTNVHQEKVMVPHWVRGKESLKLLSPVKRDLHMIGIGNSVGTGWCADKAEVISVDSFEALEKLGKKVQGKIVLFNRPMDSTVPPFDAYDAIFTYRTRSASRAAKLGAKGVLVRSLTTRSLQTPHTGALRYSDDAPKIPAAAVSVEDAGLLQRFLDQGKSVRVRLKMGAKMKGDAPSANVLAEIPGTEKPEEIVLVGAHIDSWDITPGAHDDGAGVVASMEVGALLKKLGLRAKRTIRIVLFTNEENGLKGARKYFEEHKHENHVAGIESDAGGYKPLGFTVEGSEDALAALETLAQPLEQIDAARIRSAFSGVDLIPLVASGMPGLGLEPDPTHYFDLHHTTADTFDKIDHADLNLQVAAMTVMAWQIANAPEALPRRPAAPSSH